MATQKQGAETLERLLTAGEELVLNHGFSGTSISDVLKGARVSKGAFFHHFKSKEEFERALVERWWERNIRLFEQMSTRADECANDPLQAALLFMGFIEESLDKSAQPIPGCMLALYAYDSKKLGANVDAYVDDAFRRWIQFYEKKFAAVIALREPRISLTAEELAEQVACMFEGSIVIARARSDPQVVRKQLCLARAYVQILFANEGC